MPDVCDTEARRIRQEMERDEVAFLQSQPNMRVRVHWLDDLTAVRDLDRADLESVARRNIEKAVERTLRNKNSTTQA